MNDITAEDISAWFESKGTAMAVIRLTEDHFRYRYVDVPEDVVREMTAEGLYDPAAHTFGELDATENIPCSVVTKDGIRDPADLTAWKTPCGHSRLWTNEIDRIAEEGDFIFLYTADGRTWFLNWSDGEVRENLLAGKFDAAGSPSLNTYHDYFLSLQA